MSRTMGLILQKIPMLTEWLIFAFRQTTQQAIEVCEIMKKFGKFWIWASFSVLAGAAYSVKSHHLWKARERFLSLSDFNTYTPVSDLWNNNLHRWTCFLYETNFHFATQFKKKCHLLLGIFLSKLFSRYQNTKGYDMFWILCPTVK